MTNHSNRSNLTAILATLEAELIAAGVRRDGCGEAHIKPVLAVLNALYGACPDLSAPRAKTIDALRFRAMRIAQFCRIHDRAARGEIDTTTCEIALAAVRYSYAASKPA